ncbi:hypothetical protein CR970_03745 [Candidatus Saccharibacteria bacterium]|nr:MAG: hypothetical protein CR970_03745 [Candidatus Saccharibacteria bacterium]
MQKPTKAIIPVAGYGTRRLPVAKSVEKCMLPLLNRPIIDYVVRDLIAAGVRDVYFVVSAEAQQLRGYYRRDIELEEYLKAQGKANMLDEIMPPEGVVFHYIQQDERDARYGTAVPVWLAGRYIAPEESFYMASGDQTLWRSDGQSEAALLHRQVEAEGADGGLVGVEVPASDVRHYGIIRMDEQGRYAEIVDRPSPETAPSRLNNTSIYMLPGAILPYVDAYMRTDVRGGEYLFTDVVNNYVRAGHSLTVRASDAEYLDCGTLDKWVAANSFLLQKTSK